MLPGIIAAALGTSAWAQQNPGLTTQPSGRTLADPDAPPAEQPVDLSRPAIQQDVAATADEAEYLNEAKKGRIWAQTRLGILYARSENDEQRLENAVKLLTAAAEASDPEAQYELAILYAGGRGTQQSLVDALRYCRLAAEQGYLPAVYSLGSLLAAGEVGFADDAEAARWFSKGAEEGDANSMFALANLKLSGKGAAKDDAGAVALLEIASEWGD